MQKSETPRYFIHSLARGFAVLNSFLSSDRGLSLSEVAELNNINHSTAHRYIFTLKELGYVIIDPATKKYKPATKFISSALSALQNMDLRSRVLPYMKGVTRELRVTTDCTILSGTEIVFVDRIRSGNVVELDLTMGARLPAHCTASGRAMLAFIDPSEALKIIDQSEFKKYTSYTITDKKTLLRELHLTRKRRYAINSQQLILRMKTFAAPIFKGNVVEGAFAIACPIDRLKAEGFEKIIIERTKSVAKKTSL